MQVRAFVFLVVLAIVATVLVISGSGPDGPMRPDARPEGPTAQPTSPDPVAADGAEESDKPAAPAPIRTRASSLPSPIDLNAQDRDLDLFGVVTDNDDRPIPGALVEAMFRPGRRTSVMDSAAYYRIEAGPKTLTAEDGTFSIRLARGQTIELRVSADGFAAASVPGCQAGEQVRVVLPLAQLSLEVTTIDETGLPVSNVELRLWRRDPGSMIYGEQDGVTNDAGKHLFDGVTAGSLTVSATHPKYGSPGWTKVDIAEEGTTSLELQMPTGRAIRGRVTDAATGLPIEGAVVGEGWTMRRNCRTDAEGRYELPGFSGNGIYDIHVTAAGYGRQGKDVPDSDALDFALAPGDRAIGRLVAIDGSAISGAAITAFGSQSGSGVQEIDTRSTSSQSDGSFELDGLRRDLPHTLVVLATGHGRYLLDFDPHPDAQGTIDLGEVVIPDGRAIEGVVVNGLDEPIAGVQVSLGGTNGDRARLTGRREERPHHYGRGESRRTDDLGRYRFPDQSPGEYTLTARLPNRPEVKIEVILNEDDDRLDTRIVIAEGRSFRVQVTTVTGAPIEGAWLRFGMPGSPSQRSDANGEAVFEGLPDREMTLSVSATGYVYGHIKAAPGQTRGSIVLHAAARISGTVVDRQGAPVPSIRLRAESSESGNSTLLDAAEDGTFNHDAMAGERINFSVVADQWKFDEHGNRIQQEDGGVRGELIGVTAPAENLLLIVDRVRMDLTAQVRVVDPNGDPASGAAVFTHDDIQGTVRIPGVTDAMGAITVPGLTTEGAQVFARASPSGESEIIPSALATVIPGAAPVTLALRRGVSLGGTFSKGPGLPAIAGATIFAHSPEAAWYPQAITDNNGQFSLWMLPGVSWTIYANGPNDSHGQYKLSDAELGPIHVMSK